VRQLLTPRWLALTVLALVLVGSFAWLGRWQLDRARELQQAPVGPDPAPVSLNSLDPAQAALSGAATGRLVRVSGQYDPVHTFVVPGRTQSGKNGYWVVAIMRLADGNGVLVVRGWTGSATIPAAQAVPPGAVTVVGRLQQAEASDSGSGQVPDGQLPSVSPVWVLSAVGYPLRDGFVILRAQTPPAAAGLALVPSPRASAVSVLGFYLQHLAYAVLWWLFAAFVVFFWFRVVRDEVSQQRPPPGTSSAGPGAAPVFADPPAAEPGARAAPVAGIAGSAPSVPDGSG